jgi:hypothetical protein
MRMMTKIDMKIADKSRGIFLLILIIIGVAGILLLDPRAPVAVAQDESNVRPVAVISGSLLVYVGHEVYLDGSGSYDPGGSPIDYQWKLMYSPEGSDAVITDDTEAQASFTADKVGVYQVQLIVNNGFRNSRPAYATITVTRHPYMW